MKGLHLDIVSPDKEIFNGEVDSVTLPALCRHVVENNRIIFYM